MELRAIPANLVPAVGVGLVVLFLGVVLMGRYHREILNDY